MIRTLSSISTILLLTGAASAQVFTSASSSGPSGVAVGLLSSGGASTPTGGSRSSWTISTSRVSMASPKIVDLDHDGQTEIVMVAGGLDSNPYGSGELHVRDGAGVSWPGFPVALSGASFNTPAVGDLDGDGDFEIVVGTWNYLYVFNHDGSAYPGWPKSMYIAQGTTVADLDGDGDLEILAAGGSSMHVYHHDGSNYTGFPVSGAHDLTTPAVGDVDGDGDLEIFAGGFLGPGSASDEVHGWHHDGTVIAGFPVTTAGSVKAAPALADLDGDGTMEVIANCWNKSGSDRLYVWDHDGNLESGWPLSIPYIRLSSPTVADLDLDGDLEIVQGGWDTSPYGEEVHALHHDGTPVTGFPVTLSNSPSGNLNNSLVTGDIDGDGQAEIVIKAVNNIFALNADGSVVSGFPVFLDDQSHSSTFTPTPALGDPDGDGSIEIIAAAAFDSIISIDQTGASTPTSYWWPTYQYDAANTGAYAAPIGDYIAYCSGDGSGAQCPCANNNDGSLPGAGCDNGVFASGAQLTGSGLASVGADTLVLTTVHLEPVNSGLYFQANTDLSPGIIWGDGLRCAGGQLKRLQVRFADAAGTSSTTIGISAKAGNVSAGDIKRYQCWYRTTQAPPCGSGVNDFNASNGLEVTWTL
jgi:hypothetical protein